MSDSSPDRTSAGTGKDETTARRAVDQAEDVPAAGEGPIGPEDPVERVGGMVDVLEEESAFLGAGPPDQEAPESPPFSSSLYPGSSEATGMTHVGDQVTGIEDGPGQDLHVPTTPDPLRGADLPEEAGGDNPL